MRCVFPMVLLIIAGCSSGPGADGAPRLREGATKSSATHVEAAAEGTGAAAAPEPAGGAEVGDLGAAELRVLVSRLGCSGAALPACEAIALFGAGRAPHLAPGAHPGVALPLSPGAPAAVAVLMVRGQGEATQVAWGVTRPHDPADASRLASVAADLLAGHAPDATIDPAPGLTFGRPSPTRGTSVAVSRSPKVLARQAGERLVLMILDPEPVLVAVHRP